MLSNILKGEPEDVEYFETATPLPHECGAGVFTPPEFKKELQFVNSVLVSFCVRLILYYINNPKIFLLAL